MEIMKNYRVLIIDDDALNVHFIANVLHDIKSPYYTILSFAVVVNRDMELNEVIEFIITNKINFVITDLQMFRFNGLQLLEVINQHSILSSQVTTRVLQTGALDNEVTLSAFGLKSIPLSKPVSVKSLKRCVNELT